jgi:hypothetical protein
VIARLGELQGGNLVQPEPAHVFRGLTMKRFQGMSTEQLRLELATALHDRECAKLAALFGVDVAGWLLVNMTKIAKLRKLLAVP